MRTDLPTGMKTTAQDLAPDAIVSLFRLDLRDGSIIRFNPHYDLNWNGQTWSFIACTLSDITRDPTGKISRPKFTFVNPAGIFSSVVQQGNLDNAGLTRYRMLKADLDAGNVNAYVTEKYFITKIVSINKDMVTTECRDVFDGPLFRLPARGYYPPEFPHVSL